MQKRKKKKHKRINIHTIQLEPPNLFILLKDKRGGRQKPNAMVDDNLSKLHLVLIHIRLQI